MISIVSRFFNLILRLLGYLGFCFEGLSWLSVSISSNLFSVSISEICGLCLLDSFFQGDLFWGLAVGFQCCPIFWWEIVRFCSDGRDAWSFFLGGGSSALLLCG